MNRNQVAYIGILAGVATVSNIHGRKQQHKKQIKVLRHLADEMLVLFRAYARVQKKIANGDYDGTDPNRIEEQLNFEIIAAHYE